MIRSLIAVLLVLCIGSAYAEIVQGRDYEVLPSPQTTDSPDKIEVIEFFSYACPHCAEFHPSVTKWAKALPDDAVFIRVPVSFGRVHWGQLVRAYYALEATGDLHQLDDALFEAIHREGRPLFSEDALAAWVGEKGGDADKFRQAFNSREVSQKSLRAEQLTRAYRVSGVPQIAVNGKYLARGRTHADTLRIADELVAHERAAMKAAQTE